MWFMDDQEMADATVERFRNGVSVRALVDPRRNTTTPMNAVILAQFQQAGIPMRQKGRRDHALEVHDLDRSDRALPGRLLQHGAHDNDSRILPKSE